MRGVAPSGLVRAMRRFIDEKIDRFQESEFYLPSYVLVILGSERAGERDDMDQPHHLVIDSITPETETTSHYFWSVPRRHVLDDAALSQKFYDITKGAFDEDAAMIEAQQRLITSDPTQSPLVNLEADGAAAAARRIVTRKLREQAATVQAAE
jgi:vanillate O-demethylase monooxygenase subunit